MYGDFCVIFIKKCLIFDVFDSYFVCDLLWIRLQGWYQRVMDYDFIADLTTLVSTYLLPVLVGYGFSETTSNAIVGIVIGIVMIACNMLNEMYTSKHLTKDNIKEDIIDDISSESDSIDDEDEISVGE